MFRAFLLVALFAVLFFALQELLIASGSSGTLVAALGAGFILLAIERRPLRDLGFAVNRKALPQLLIGLVLGFGGLMIACALLFAAGSLRYSSDAGSVSDWFRGIGWALLILVIPAAAEEALFRGYAFQKLAQGFGAVLATAGISLAFALAHARNPSVSVFALANIFAAGIMLSVAFLRTRSLWFATGVHLGWNWSMAALLDLPVSGFDLFDTPMYEPVDRGPRWLTGAAFGPEAGIAGLLGLLLVLGGVLWTTRKFRWLTLQG
jgi:uncharacterized protein